MARHTVLLVLPPALGALPATDARPHRKCLLLLVCLAPMLFLATGLVHRVHLGSNAPLLLWTQWWHVRYNFESLWMYFLHLLDITHALVSVNM